MKNDIDRLMLENDIDALLIMGPGQHNPVMVYLTGGGHLTSADLIQARGNPALLFHGAMERDEAAKSGLKTRSYDLYTNRDLDELNQFNPIESAAQRYVQMLQDAGISSGNVAIYGKIEIGTRFNVLQRVQALLPGIHFSGFVSDPIFMTAMMTKDELEVERIRKMGKITTEVVGKVARYLQSRTVKEETLFKENGEILTIGDVKGKINLWLAEAGVENPEGTIFALGHDAGVPHSQGDNAQAITLGRAIVFDIYPCEAGGGYYYDFTRTWCLGYAPPEVQQAYDQVKNVYDTLISELEFDKPFSHYQRRTCSLFGELGHPTIQSHPGTIEGYVHSVGHGLGLRLHEMPFSGANATPKEKLVPGCIFTIEPGLYYPDRNFGIRIEDSYYANPKGYFEKLAEFPYELVLKMD